jgi:hypothetical protein
VTVDLEAVDAGLSRSFHFADLDLGDVVAGIAQIDRCVGAHGQTLPWVRVMGAQDGRGPAACQDAHNRLSIAAGRE